MPAGNEKIGDLIRRGMALFSGVIPIPAAGLVAAIAAAAVSKLIEIHDRRITEVLSSDLRLSHIPYVEPNQDALLRFFTGNLLYPELATEFANEIAENNLERLSAVYPFLYSALILKRQVPALLFHSEITKKEYRNLAVKYQSLSQGYQEIEGDPELVKLVSRFGSQLFEVLNETYEGAKDELRNKENRIAFDLIDYIREIAVI